MSMISHCWARKGRLSSRARSRVHVGGRAGRGVSVKVDRSSPDKGPFPSEPFHSS